MDAEELLRIVCDVEDRLGWIFDTQEICSTYQYALRKAAMLGKGKDYIPILFESELENLVRGTVINFLGRKKQCVRSAV